MSNINISIKTNPVIHGQMIGGKPGLTAYQVWLSQGNVGTEADYLVSLKGDQGDPFVYADFTSEQLAAIKDPLDQVAEDVAAAEALRVPAEAARVVSEGNRVIAEGQRVTAEQGRVTVEGQRVTAEQARAAAEALRVPAESGRASAEVGRVNAEFSRVGAESSRVGAENTRVSNENARMVFQAYNGTTAYLPGNKVAYNGSSYVCILASTGNLPTNTTYWLLIAQKGDNGSAGVGGLVASYTYTGNVEIVVSAVDTTTNVLTSVGHGLINGDTITPTLNLSAGNLYPLQKYAGGMTQVTYYVVNKTTDTFQISLTNGGAAIDLTVNASIDLTKWHFEKSPASTIIAITGLPASNRYRVKVSGKGLTIGNNIYAMPNSQGIEQKWLCDGYTTYNYPIVSTNGLGTIMGFLDMYFETGQFSKVYSLGSIFNANNANQNAFAGTKTVWEVICPIENYIGQMTSIGVYFLGGQANGTKVEVYSA